MPKKLNKYYRYVIIIVDKKGAKMGTRNLTAVIIDNKPCIAQYGQWDGYPECTGAHIFDFLRDIILSNRLEEFKEKTKQCVFVTDKDIDNKYKSLGIDISSGFIAFEDAHKFKDVYPQLDRDMGCDVLDFVLENGGCELINQYEFINDALFCEWAYVSDMDNECLEVYGGAGSAYKTSERFPEMTCYKVPFKDIAKTATSVFVKTANKRY